MSTSIPATHLDIVQNAQVVMLSTSGPSGAPQTTALWFLLDDDGKIRLSINAARQKVKNLIRDPKVSLFFIDTTNPYRTVEIRGTASAEPDPDYVFAEKVGTKYGGTDMRKMDKPGESRLVVTIEPTAAYVFGKQE